MHTQSHEAPTSTSDADATLNVESGCLTAANMEVNPLYLFYFRKLGPLKPVLIQAEDPWKLLVAVTLLNKTTGKVAIPVFWSILDRWPTPFLLSRADEADLTDALRRVGTQSVRAKRLIQLSFNYMLDPPRDYDLRPTKHKSFHTRKRYPATQISHLPGVGAYALDSYRIFCCSLSAPTAEEWKHVRPTDKQLIRYLKWKWAYEEHKEWTPEQGALGPLTISNLKLLVHELRAFKPKDSSSFGADEHEIIEGLEGGCGTMARKLN